MSGELKTFRGTPLPPVKSLSGRPYEMPFIPPKLIFVNGVWKISKKEAKRLLQKAR